MANSTKTGKTGAITGRARLEAWRSSCGADLQVCEMREMREIRRVGGIVRCLGNRRPGGLRHGKTGVRRRSDRLLGAFCGAVAMLSAMASAAAPEPDQPWRFDRNISNRALSPPPETPLNTGGRQEMDFPETVEQAFPATVEQAKSNFARVGEELQALGQQLDWGAGDLGAYVEDVETSIVIFDRGGARPMIPGSCQKLATTAAALGVLGPAFQFVSHVEYVGRIEPGRLEGALIVRGSGDPSISTRLDPTEPEALAPLRDWARRIKAAGISTIQGHMIGDDRLLDATPCARGWPVDLPGQWLCPEVSALSFNDNVVDFLWVVEKKHRGRARYDLQPRLDTIRVLNDVQVDAKLGRDWRTYLRPNPDNLFEAKGYVPAGIAVEDCAAIHDPTRFFLESLRQALADEGVAHVDGLLLPISDVSAPEVVTRGARLLFAHRSDVLARLIEPILRYDQDARAELLFKTLGRMAGRAGSFEEGAEAVKDFLRRRDLLTPGAVIMDGSGLSRLNRMTPSQAVRLMKSMRRRPDGGAFFAAFPRAGSPGALAGRFQWGEEARRAAPRVYALAGRLPGTHALCGWTSTDGGRRIFFAFMLNGSSLPKDAARENLDRLVMAICRSPLRAQ
jgi:D-alanyl-D-alanine carboxypeptidase/D-alanyl-D-alanine-endopeptidase (penicillin-binding protein 4)